MDIVYGTALDSTQLNATADVPGTFAYTPDTNAVLTAGTHTLQVDFTPNDAVNYTGASKEVNINVTISSSLITWSNPTSIVYGTELDGAQLNATAGIPGSFTYSPIAGSVLIVGTHTLHVDFAPNDADNYAPTSSDVSLIVTQATPVLDWSSPSSITYGTALSAAQLNTTANIPGAFAYTPTTGALLAVGTHTLHVDFTPTDDLNYMGASKDVSIDVTQATPVITWANPANISHGTALSSTQLNATADVPAGTFTYTPASGAVLTVGIHTLHVDFAPTDAVNYANASKDVSINVLEITAPLVVSITRVNSSPTKLESVDFTVTFSESVTGVDENDFALTATGAISDASVVSVTGGPIVYTVTVNTGIGNGTIRLDLKASGTSIQDSVGNPVSGGFTSGAVYTIVKTYYLFLPLFDFPTGNLSGD